MLSLGGSSNAEYWASNATYRTENDQLILISRNVNGGFTVTTQSGQIIKFGHITGTRAYRGGDYNGVTKAWLMESVEDAYGNKYTINYTHYTADGGYMPSSMTFPTMGTATGSVVFGYTDRLGSRSWGYERGQRYDRGKKIMNEITTYSGTVPVKHYEISYENSPATGRDRIDWIEECGYNNQGVKDNCAVKLDMEWGDGDRGFTTGADFHASQADPFRYMDLDGSGNYVRETDENVYGTIVTRRGIAVLKKQANSTASTGLVVEYKLGNYPDYTITSIVQKSSGTGENLVLADKVIFADFNNDGLTDVIAGEKIWIQDQADVLHFTSSDNNIYEGTAGWAEVAVLDLNNDGMPDLLRTIPDPANLGDNKVQVYLQFTDTHRFQNTGVDYPVSDTRSVALEENRWTSGSMFRLLGDFNGDGQKDIAYHRKETGETEGEWKVLINKGDGYFDNEFTLATTLTSGSRANQNQQGYAFDYNRDGLSDLIIKKAGEDCEWRVVVSSYVDGVFDFVELEGEQPFNGDLGGVCEEKAVPELSIFRGDQNNDGYQDLMGGYPQRYYAGKPGKPDLLTSVENGFGDGTVVEFYYSSLKPSNYFSNRDSPYPLVPASRSKHVVTEMRTTNGVMSYGYMGENITEYSYENFNQDVTGRYYSGFKKITQTDTAAKIATTTVTEQEGWAQGHPISVVVKRKCNCSVDEDKRVSRVSSKYNTLF